MHVLRLAVRLHVQLECLVSHIQCYNKKVDNSFVCIDFNFQTMFLEYSGNFLFYFLSPAGSESAVAQPVIAVQAEGDLEVLEFIENEEADNIAGLGAVKGSYGI